MTERRDIPRLSTGARAMEGPAPVDSPGISLCAPIRRRPLNRRHRNRGGTSTPNCYSGNLPPDRWVRPRRPKHRIPDTPPEKSTMKTLARLLLVLLSSSAAASDDIRAMGKPAQPDTLAAVIEFLKDGRTPHELTEIMRPVRIDEEVYIWTFFHFGGDFLQFYPPTREDHILPLARPYTLPDPCTQLGDEFKGLTTDRNKVIVEPIGCVAFYEEKSCFSSYIFQCDRRTKAELHRLRRERERLE